MIHLRKLLPLALLAIALACGGDDGGSSTDDGPTSVADAESSEDGSSTGGASTSSSSGGESEAGSDPSTSTGDSNSSVTDPSTSDPSTTDTGGNECAPPECTAYDAKMTSCYPALTIDWYAECLDVYDICDIGGFCWDQVPSVISCALETPCDEVVDGACVGMACR